MEENYQMAKKIVSLKYDRDDKFYPFFVLAIFTFLHKYSSLIDVIQDIFLNTTFYIENGSVYDINQKYNLSLYGLEKKSSNNEVIVGKYFPNVFFTICDSKVTIHKENPIIVCSLAYSNTLAFTVFVHEMNHLVKSYINGYGQYEDDQKIGFYTRCGVEYYQCDYDKNSQTFHSINCNSIFDEVINTLQTTEMLSYLYSSNHDSFEPFIQEYFQQLKKNFSGIKEGYGLCINVMKQLWKNDVFRTLVEDNIHLGNVADIVQGIDDVLGENSFENMSVALDELDELDFSGEKPIKRKRLVSYLEKKVKLYNKRIDNSYLK